MKLYEFHSIRVNFNQEYIKYMRFDRSDNIYTTEEIKLPSSPKTDPNISKAIANFLYDTTRICANIAYIIKVKKLKSLPNINYVAVCNINTVDKIKDKLNAKIVINNYINNGDVFLLVNNDKMEKNRIYFVYDYIIDPKTKTKKYKYDFLFTCDFSKYYDMLPNHYLLKV